ncbi:MAG TPA: DedA family protein [Verrucomicrobiae bacterium]|nr:DedA family protein [Verrucomicrobiae bacterium]
MSEATQFLISYGGLFLFLVAFAEESGLPFPAEPFLLAAGALASSGKCGLITAVCWPAAGCLAADAIWFHLGHRGSSRVLRMFPHLHAVRGRLQQATLTGTLLHGARMLTAAKFLPFGSVVPLHAGAMEVGASRFVLVDALASVLYAAVYVFLGSAFHGQLEQLMGLLRKLGTVSFVLIAILAGAHVSRWFLKHRPKR